MAIENPSRRQLLRGQFLQSLHSENAKIQGINAIRPTLVDKREQLYR